MMEESNTDGTPKLTHPRFRRFLRPSPSTSFKSPMINKMVKRIDFGTLNASIDELKNAVLELWQKNEDLKKELSELSDQGYKEEQLKLHMDKLHEYNEIKDTAQMVMGKIATLQEVTVREIHKDFGMTDED